MKEEVKLGKVAFLGLGVMGAPMAGHLAKAGYDVTVYNRTSEKAEGWCNKYGGQLANTPAEASEGAEAVFACVGNDDDIRSITQGETGAFCAMRVGSVFVDHTTTSASVAKELSDAGRQLGIGFVDAPVSGGQRGAEEGILTVMCGGTRDDFEAVTGMIKAYSQSCVRLGEAGAGQLTKMVNQVCIAGLLQGLSEGLLLAESAGLDGARVIDVISKGAAQSWQMENRSATMLAGEYEHGFAVEWMRKDLAICLDQAERMSVKLPVTELVDQYYKEIEEAGGSRWDTSSLYARIKNIRVCLE